MKVLFSVVLLFIASHVVYSSEELIIPNDGERSGQNKYERLGNLEKQLITLYEAQNSSRKEQLDFISQLNLLKSDYQKMKEDNDKLSKENLKAKEDLDDLKKKVAELKRNLDQIRTSVYGEEGKKEKDEFLKKPY